MAYDRFKERIEESVAKKNFSLVIDSIGVDHSFRDKILKMLNKKNNREKTYCVCVVLEYEQELIVHLNKLR